MHIGTADYEFTYTIDGDQLKMDYESNSVSDCTYTFTLTENVLTLVGGEGTTGGTYTLTK